MVLFSELLLLQEQLLLQNIFSEPFPLQELLLLLSDTIADALYEMLLVAV